MVYVCKYKYCTYCFPINLLNNLVVELHVIFLYTISGLQDNNVYTVNVLSLYIYIYLIYINIYIYDIHNTKYVIHIYNIYMYVYIHVYIQSYLKSNEILLFIKMYFLVVPIYLYTLRRFFSFAYF